jgi:hypothetical protein
MMHRGVSSHHTMPGSAATWGSAAARSYATGVIAARRLTDSLGVQGSASRPTAHIMYDFIHKVQPALPRRAPRCVGGTPLLQRQRVLPWNRPFEIITYHRWRVGQNTDGHTRVSPGPASPRERAPELRAFLAYLTRHTRGGFDPDCRCEHTCLPLPPCAQAGSPSHCGDRAGQKAWQKITGPDPGGRPHGPDLSPSREP